jgi:hypothetical protein
MAEGSRPSGYRVDADTAIGRYVPVDEPVFDIHGNEIDERYVDRAVEEVHRALGRPSLSGRANVSPTVSFRLPSEERRHAERIAEAEGTTVSALAREAFARYLAEHPGA